MAKKTFVSSIRDVISNTSSQDLEFRPARSDQLICYDRIIALDETANPTLITIGLKRGTSEVVLMGGTPAAVGQAIVAEGKFFAPGDYRPFARIIGGSSGDKVVLSVLGYTTDLPD